jgi:hypothetical protein
MALEFCYLVALFLACPVILFLLGARKLDAPLDLSHTEGRALSLYGSAWIGGLLGGCVYSMKWLYHSIGRGKWHLDRRAWRFLTPLVSSGLAFGTLSLLISGAVPLLSENITRSQAGICGIAFLVGYFSDDTVAALATWAKRLLRAGDESPDVSGERSNRN